MRYYLYTVRSLTRVDMRRRKHLNTISIIFATVYTIPESQTPLTRSNTHIINFIHTPLHAKQKFKPHIRRRAIRCERHGIRIPHPRPQLITSVNRIHRCLIDFHPYKPRCADIKIPVETQRIRFPSNGGDVLVYALARSHCCWGWRFGRLRRQSCCRSRGK